MVIEVKFELVGETNVDQRRDGADPPAGEQPDEIVDPIMSEDRHSVSAADPEVMKRASEALHRLHGLRVGERDVAVDPAKRRLVGLTRRPVEQQLMHQHG